MTKEQQNELYEAELNTLVHLPSESIPMHAVIKKYGLRRLRLGRRCTGEKVDVKQGKRVPKYKTTAYRVLFYNDLELNVSPFLYRQLKKREKLTVETFNCW